MKGYDNLIYLQCFVYHIILKAILTKFKMALNIQYQFIKKFSCLFAVYQVFCSFQGKNTKISGPDLQMTNFKNGYDYQKYQMSLLTNKLFERTWKTWPENGIRIGIRIVPLCIATCIMYIWKDILCLQQEVKHLVLSVYFYLSIISTRLNY